MRVIGKNITVYGFPTHGNAFHVYGIGDFNIVNFQEGPVKENGVNGCQNEDLLAIVIDRLECFQSGSLACEENARALRKIEEGLGWLRYRTADRVRRGVEGTHKT